MRGSKARALRRTPIIKRRQQSREWTRELAAVCSLIGTLTPASLWALPQDGAISAGSATINTPTSTTMRIDQATDRIVIDWARFNIAASESVRFQQPSAASIALNRVSGYEASGIFGSLSANGQVIISNPSGILFSPSSRVDVGALTATTLNITNQDFLAGQFRFSQYPAHDNAAVVNQGIITAGPGGYVALLGAAAHNEGVIQAQLGSVVLGAGKAATLDMRGDGKIGFVMSDSVSGAVTGPTGETLASYVSNSGTIRADGGTVMLSARAATDIIKSVVNHEGIIEARSLEERNGQIFLNGGPEGIVSVSGTTDASGAEKGQTGGTVQVVGDKVGLFGARINVAGDSGGGTVLIGGDYQGHGTVQNASRTYVSGDSTINSDALTHGDGGKVIVWADDITRYAGHISARGGAQTGNGGFVEVSGKNLLRFDGRVDLNAVQGTGGMLLLDPLNATLSTAADANTAGFTAGADNTEAFNDDAGLASTFNVNAGGSFAGVGNGATITVEATNNISVNNNFVLATATGNTDVSLVMRAGTNIGINANVTASGTGTINLTADQGFAGFPSNGVGEIRRGAVGNTISQANGTLTLSAATGITATTAVGSLSATNATSGNIAITNAGTLNVASLSETGGNTTLTNTGALTLGAINQTGGILTASATGGLTLNGNITSTGNVSLTSVGVTQTAGTTVNAGAGTILVDANNGAINMNGILQTTNNTISAITLRDATTAALGNITATSGRVVLGNIAASNNLSGAITQNPGTAINANSLSVNGGSTIALDNANQIGTLSTVTRGGAFSLTDTTGGLIITGPITAGTTTNSVSLVTAGGSLAANGNITANQVSLTGAGVTQTAATTVNAGGGIILIDANDGAINMNGTLTTTNAGATAIRIIDATTVALGNITAASGTVVLGEAGGDNLSGALIQNTTTLNAGTVIAITDNAISLSRPTNLIGTLGPITRGGALTVVDSAGGLFVNGPITGGTITNAVSLTTAGGAPLAINGNISTSGSNSISLTGVGVTYAGGGTVNADAGNVTVDAGVGQYSMAAGSSIQTSGNVTVSANTINLAGLIQATGQASEVKLAPDTASTVTNLGAGAAAGFALTDTELNTIEASIMRIGSVAGAPFGGATSGAITLTGNFTPDAQFATNLMELRTTGAVTATAGALNLGTSNSNLVLRTGGVVNIGTANHDFNGVAATSSTNSAITLRDGVNGMTIAAVDGLNGLATANGTVAVTAAGTLALDADVIKSGSSSVSLTGAGVTQSPGTTVNAGSGAITVDANDGAINLNGTLTTTNAGATAVRIIDATTVALGNITATAGTAVLGAAAPAGDNLSGAVTQNPGTVLNVNSLSITGGSGVTLDNANQITNVQATGAGGTISVTDTTGNLAVTGATNTGGALTLSTSGNLAIAGSISSGTVRLLAGNNITRSGGFTVTATDLLLDATNGIGTASVGILTNVSSQLAARITGPAATGDIVIADGGIGDTTIGTVAGISGLSTTNNRSITVFGVSGSINIGADITAAGAGDVTLFPQFGSIVSQGGRVSTGSGTVALSGVGVGTLAAPILTNLGTGELTVLTGGAGSSGNIAISNNTPGGLNTSQVTALNTDASVNSILLEQTAGNVTVDGLLNLGTDNLSLAAPGGAIVDGNGAANNVTAATFTATSANGINLDTTVPTLTFANTVSGDVGLRNNGNASVAGTNAGGAVILFSTGALTSSGGVGGSAGTTLTAVSVGFIPDQTGIGTTPLILTGGGPLTITVTGATSTDGISVRSAAALQLGQITATGGGGRVIVLDSTGSGINPSGAAPQVQGGKVILLASTLADIGSSGNLLVDSTAPPVLCGTSGGGAAGTSACTAPANVNGSAVPGPGGVGAGGAFLVTPTPIEDQQAGILSLLTTTQLGPPSLLSSGILPETFFRTLDCENFEGGVCPTASEEEEPSGVVIVEP